jgi:cathepsin L
MRLVPLLCLSLWLSCALAAKLKWYEIDSSYTFEAFLQHYGKSYSNAKEYQMRKEIFEFNRNKIITHNQDTTKTWKEEVNHLADLTQEEYGRLRGYNKKLGYSRREMSSRATISVNPAAPPLPTAVDWRAKGIVTAVKDQGGCGSCWSFATAETIESHWAIKQGVLWDLSEQQILDCTSNPQHCGGTGGCGGGTAEVAMDTIIKLGGLSSEWTYPYVSHGGSNSPKCLVVGNMTNPAATISGYISLPSNEYLPLLTAVATVGPISISVDASSWQFYSTGVFNGCNQTNPDIDHAVQLVGYGSEAGGDYWLVRNSWTPTWGEGGYIKVFRTATVQCGIDSSPSDGSGCDNGPPTVTVCGTCGILYDNVYPTIA